MREDREREKERERKKEREKKSKRGTPYSFLAELPIVIEFLRTT